MNISELLEELNKRKISLTGRAISQIWGMDETSFSKKKKSGTPIKQKNIKQLEDALGIKLVKYEINDTNCVSSFKRRYISDIDDKLQNAGKRLDYLKSVNNLTCLQMSAITGAAEEQISDVITGASLPDLSLLNKLKQNFDISVDWLLYGE